MTAAHVHARYVQPCIAWHVRMRLWPHQSDMHAHMHAWHDMHSTTHGNMHVNMLACTCACACCADLHVAWMNGQKWTNDIILWSPPTIRCAHTNRDFTLLHLVIVFIDENWMITLSAFIAFNASLRQSTHVCFPCMEKTVDKVACEMGKKKSRCPRCTNRDFLF